MSRRLRTDVYVGRVRFPAGTLESDVPADAIPNRKAWVEDPDTAPPVADSPADPAVPSRNGPGSSREAWSDYARRHGVEVGQDQSRADIIAALDAAGVPTS